MAGLISKREESTLEKHGVCYFATLIVRNNIGAITDFHASPMHILHLSSSHAHHFPLNGGLFLLDMNLQYGLAAKLATPVVHFRRSLSTSLHSD